MSHDDTVYRVMFLPDNISVNVIALGMNALELPHQGVYNKEELPTWMRDRLSSLAILRPPPPENNVESVGKRISDTVFWVYPE